MSERSVIYSLVTYLQGAYSLTLLVLCAETPEQIRRASLSSRNLKSNRNLTFNRNFTCNWRKC